MKRTVEHLYLTR